MRVNILLFAMLLFICSCGGNSNGGHNHTDETAHTEHNHEAHEHADHEGHNHEAEEHDHEGHNHAEGEGHDHDHEGHDHEAEGHDHSHDEGIHFSAAQASELDFAVSPVKRQPFTQVVKTGGVIEAAQGDEATIVATASGMVSFGNLRVSEGVAVKDGTPLLTIVSSDFNTDNYLEQYRDAKAALNKAQADLERAKELKADKIVSDKEFAAVELAYKQAELRFKTLAKNYTDEGKQVVSPLNGYVKSVLVKEGDYVTAGMPVAVVSQNRRLVLRADIPQKDYAVLRNVSSAKFVTPYDNHVYDIKEMGGRVLSVGKSAESNFFIPAKFEFDNRGNIVPGSYVEVYVSGEPIGDQIAVPLTALVEEQGVYSVYVQTGTDTYQKRFVHTGVSDGENIQIIEGVNENDRVVSKGAAYVKLAAMANVVPSAHNHSH